MINWSSLYKEAYSLERPETLKYIRYSLYKHGVITKAQTKGMITKAQTKGMITKTKSRRRGFKGWIYKLLHLQKHDYSSK